MLLSLGFKSCAEGSSLYSDRKIIIMVFIDDFLGAYYLSHAEYAYRI